MGRFGSYRLYVDDNPLSDIDFLIKDEVAILTLLTVLNLEPQLYQTLKRIFPKEKISFIYSFVKDKIFTNTNLMMESWAQEFFIKSLFYLDSSEFFKTANLVYISTKLYEHDKSQEKISFKYLELILILIKLNIKNTDGIFTAKSFETNVEDFISQLKKMDEKIFNELRFAFTVYIQVQRNKALNYHFPINKYYKLREYYTQVNVNENKHDDKLLTNLFKESNKSISELKHSIENSLSGDIEKNIASLKQSLVVLQGNYNKHDHFKFIKDIVLDLFRYSNFTLPFDIEKTNNCIVILEKVLSTNNTGYRKLSEIEKVEVAIDNYKSNLLLSKCGFEEYIMRSNCNIVDEWKIAEETFKKSHIDNIGIDFTMAKNLKVNVNPYALSLAFENLLSNKYSYAQNVQWRMFTKEFDDYIELYIEQSSAFQYDKGDGTGQHYIKSILKNYGVLYKKVFDNPYTLKITFSNN